MHLLPPEPEVPLSARLADAGRELGEEVFIRVFKQENVLEMWMRDGGEFVLFESYPVCRWSGDLGPKLREGDGQAPEGFYEVSQRSLNPDSRYHLSFNLGFPNSFDRALGRTGSYLMVHGGCVSVGCYAMTDPLIEEIYGLVEAALSAGQAAVQVHAFPFRMSEANLVQHEGSQWIEFWRNLQQGYDAFEATRRPPEIDSEGGRYVVSQL